MLTFLAPSMLLVKPAVAAVIRDSSGNVLLHRIPGTDAWALPTGAVEPGESVAEALRRDVAERTGLRVGIERVVGVYSLPDEQLIQYGEGAEVHFVTTLLLCRPGEGGATAGSPEGGEWRWFPPGALPDGVLRSGRRWIQDAAEDAAVVLR